MEFKGTKGELEIALTTYMVLKRNNHECTGFIDGFNTAMGLPLVEAAPELLEALQKVANNQVMKGAEVEAIQSMIYTAKQAINKALK